MDVRMEVCNLGIHPDFETQSRRKQNNNRGISGPTKRTDVLQEHFKKIYHYIQLSFRVFSEFVGNSHHNINSESVASGSEGKCALRGEGFRPIVQQLI